MSINKRTIIIICGTLLALLIAVNVICDVIYREGFEELERQTVEKNVTQVTDALSASLNALVTFCYDWAVRDDTYQFAQHNNQDYVDRNFQNETFISSKISLISVFNSSGEMVYIKAYDLVKAEEIHLPDNIASTLTAEGLATPANTDNIVAGIILLTSQPMLVVSRPVLTSLAEGPPAGAIIFGRFVDSEVISQLSETTHLSVSLLPIPSDNSNTETNRLIASLDKSGPMFIQSQSSKIIAGYTYVNDLAGYPAFIFEVVVPRDIYQEGQKAIAVLHSVLVFIGITFGIVFILLIKQLILSRLIKFSNSVSKISSSGDASGRVSEPGNDELSRLGKNINEMLASLENANKAMRESDELLRENNEQLDTILNSVPCGIIAVDEETHTIHDMNTYASHIIGIPAEEIIGKECHRFICPVEKGKCPVTDLGKRVENAEHLLINSRGDAVPILRNVARVTIGGSHYLLETFVDITERKRAEEALREREKRFSDIAGNALEWIWEVDTKGKYTYSSPVVEKILGYNPEETLEKHFYDFFLPGEREELKKAAFEAFAQKQPIKEFVNRNRCKNGKTVELLTSGVPMIDEEGNLLGYRGVDTDITERKKAEEALRESEEKFSIAFRSSPEMIIITDVENNKYLEINDSYLNATGYSREEMMSGRVDDFQKVWVNPEDLKKMTNLLQTQGKVRNEEFSFRMKSGEIRQWLSSADMVTIGGKRCMLAIAIDITERKKAEEELKEALVNLERSGEQLAATNKELETFSYSVSHDLRSPLRSIDGFSQALLEDYKEKIDETGQDYLRRLRSASQKMGELIDAILNLSRLTRAEMRHEPVDLSALADEIATRLQETQPKRRVKFVIDKSLTAKGDPQLMRVLLENLLGNAWKFTGKKPQAEIEFSMDRNNGKKAYFIRDNGAGFDMTYAHKLFGAFQRLHEVTEFPGTGIGLATVQRIINRHGGTIWAEGAVGKGATFHFTMD